MKKIISLFKRDYEGTRQVYNEIVPGAEWVIAGEGRATEKIDGTSCLIRGGKLFKRYDAKNGKTPPNNWEPSEEKPDPNTGHWPGWLPVGNEPESKWHREAFSYLVMTLGGNVPEEATYELVGPKIQGNPYKFRDEAPHELWRHGTHEIFEEEYTRTFEGIRDFLEHGRQVKDSPPIYIEGIVWHHPDGRMVKIKAKDLGLPWPIKKET